MSNKVSKVSFELSGISWHRGWRIAQAATLYMIFGCQILNAQAQDKNTKSVPGRNGVISLSVKDLPIHAAVESVASQAGLPVGWSKDLVSLDEKVSLNLENVSVDDALRIIVKGTDAFARISSDGKTIVVSKRTASDSITEVRRATGHIVGQVVDSATGQGLRGAVVIITSNGNSVVSGTAGRFVFERVPVGNYQLQIKLLGYGTATAQVSVVEGKGSQIRVVLKATATQLSGVVTTAVGEQRRLEVGNDITVIKVDSIMRVTPVATLTDLLATRVPGLQAVPTSGEPGAPTRIRIRGVSSINASNDPIVIVDGVQVYAQQGELPRMSWDPVYPDRVLSQSPLDQINLSSVENVEVLKGPSAVALYGSDAANGVIVITTKRGVAGPVEWDISANFQTQSMPGRWPTNYWAWGYLPYNENEPWHCTIANRGTGCFVDSLITYQILNDPHTTTFGRGSNQSYSGTMRGGTNSVTYSLTGSTSKEIGLTKLPDADVSLLNGIGRDVPELSRRPQRNEMQSGVGRVDIQFGISTLRFSTTLTRQLTQGSPLSDAIRRSAGFDPAVDSYDSQGELLPRGTGLIDAIPDLLRIQFNRSLRSISSLNVTTLWTDKLRTEATAGIDLNNKYFESLLKNGECLVIVHTCNGSGYFSNRIGTDIQSDLNLRASLPWSVNRYTNLTFNSGANFIRKTMNEFIATHSGLPVGSTSGFGAELSSQIDRNSDAATAGVYIGTTVGLMNRFYIPLEVRKDAGSSLGSKIAPKFPRLSFSYVVSDEPAFTNLPFSNLISTLRLRIAYGQAGRQPRPGDAVRTYSTGTDLIDGVVHTTIGIEGIGNAMLKPERTREVELGADVEAFGGRLSLSPTVYTKNTRDMLVSESLPPSVGGFSAQLTNLGDVKNKGWDLTVGVVPVETRQITWSSAFLISGHKNIITRLNRPTGASSSLGLSARAVATHNIAGYPLNGRWALPIMGYADRNGDGKILEDEVVLGDSAVFIGAPYSRFLAKIHQSMSLSGQIIINATVEHENGLTQYRDRASDGVGRSRAANDPAVSLGEQAHELYSALAAVQTTSSTRFNSFSIAWMVPRSLSSRYFSTKSIQVSLQGKNLGLWTSYRGKDPNVGARGESMTDNGRLPKPREYGISIRIN